MPENVEFEREDQFPSFFANRIQDFLSGCRTDLRLSKKSSTAIQVVPDAELGLAAIALQGRWRFNEASVNRDHPGGAKGTYSVWAVGTDNDIDNSPKPHSDHTDYAFDLRITKGEEAPSGAGVEIFEKIGEIDWSGTEIEAIRQTHGSVTGAMLADDALPDKTGSDVEWTRQPGGGYLLQLKANSVGANELADNSVDSNALIDLAVITAKVAALAITEGKLAENSVATAKIIALAVTTAKIAAAAVTEEKLGNEAVAEAKIKALAVTAAKLAAEAVTEAKIANSAVTNAKIAAEAVGTTKLANLAVTAAKIANEAVGTTQLANLGVTAAKLAAECVETAKIKDGAVTDPKLASPNNIAYRLLYCAEQNAGAAIAAGTYLMLGAGAAPLKSGTESGAELAVPFFDFVAGDFAVAGKTLKLKIRAQAAVNSVAPTGDFLVGLYPITIAGAAGKWKITLGEAIKEVLIENPGASAVARKVSEEFEAPADGAYMLGFKRNTETAANSNTKLSAQLLYHHV